MHEVGCPGEQSKPIQLAMELSSCADTPDRLPLQLKSAHLPVEPSGSKWGVGGMRTGGKITRFSLCKQAPPIM